MNNPLGRSTQKPEQQTQNNQKNNRAKEFEKQLQEEERMLAQSAGIINNTQQTNIQQQQPAYSQQQQLNQQPQSVFGQIGQMLDAPRKLFFRNTTTQQQPIQQGQRQPTDQNEPEIIQTNIVQTYTTRDIKSIGLEIVQPGEIALQELRGICSISTQQFQGIIVATNYQIVFLPDKFPKDFRKDYFYIPYTLMIKVEKTMDRKQNDANFIEISCKDGRWFKYRFLKEQNDDCNSIFNVINKNAFTLNKQTLFAFTFYKEYSNLENDYQGWKIFNIEKDFERMGINILQENSQNQNGLFKYLNNENGIICSTYYNRLVVPAKADLDCIQKTAKFRSKERIPILSYAFPINGKVISMWRSSQCRTGIGQNRSTEDECYLKYMSFQTVDEQENQYEDKEIRLRIYDARPHINAIGQQVAGKGYENTLFYRRCSIDFLDIHNIHKVRDSQTKLLKAAFNENVQFLSQLEQSQWYDHIVAIIKGSAKIAITMTKEKINVLVHCSDGWDRTAQLTALVSIMIDGQYRTLEGFMILVQKEWINSGHQFCQRSAIGNKQNNEDSRSPIFLQFLDCVFQMQQLYPLSFEFNEKLLLDLAYHHLTSLFGTFLCDSFLEIQKQRIMEQTVSIWSWIMKQKDKYMNAFYKNPQSIDQDVIIPESFTGKSITFWKGYFLYYSLESNDAYQIHPQCQYTCDNLQEMYKSLSKENHVLRQAQKDQEKLAILHQQKFNQLMQIIQETQNEEIIEKLQTIKLI
ncbi:unnamed protein product [Paramecium pentaurelia]|uniref:Myotubularin phosphatase domain-containing protein n=1 Tax=Paramecium pentaurelia TaxID=43138 RepID=A0A8S1Y9J2_9CILI|nr:unnamed protein product [Paramecium pentaurelia]